MSRLAVSQGSGGLDARLAVEPIDPIQGGNRCRSCRDGSSAWNGFPVDVELPAHCQCHHRGEVAGHLRPRRFSCACHLHPARIDGIIENMKHEILDEVWRVRDQISAECGHDLKKLAAMLRREEVKYGDRLVRLPIRRKPASNKARMPSRKRVAAHV
jgi:hypothetical protein